MTPEELLRWLCSIPPALRDSAIEEHLGISMPRPDASPPGEHLIGYHASGVAPVLRAFIDVPVVPDDMLIDLGSGLGKVVMLARLLTGAKARGIELQPGLVDRARQCAEAAGIDVAFNCADVRTADLADGTVFFLYDPFTGPVLAEVVARLRDLAMRRAVVVCALGVDLQADWLRPRPSDAFWLSIYDSVIPGVPARERRRPAIDEAAQVIARG